MEVSNLGPPPPPESPKAEGLALWHTCDSPPVPMFQVKYIQVHTAGSGEQGLQKESSSARTN